MVQAELDRYTVTHRTVNYLFHCMPGSMAERDIRRIGAYQEKWYARITQLLGVTRQEPIQYYLTDSPLDAGLIYGDGEPCNGFAWGSDTVVATYSDEVFCLGGHEDTHILSLQIGRPASVFLREGLAMFVDEGWWGKSNGWWVAQFLEEGKYIPIATLTQDDLFFEHSTAITYPIAGSFTQYCWQTLGRDDYLQHLYGCKGDPADAVQEVFGRSLSKIDTSFRKWVQELNAPERLRDDIVF